MNFGEILDQFEKSKGMKKSWLDKYAPDKHDLKEKSTKVRRKELLTGYKKLPVEEEIDLHGYTADEAIRILDNFIDSMQKRHVKKILVIHGKGLHSQGGDGILKHEVKRYLERSGKCGAFGHPKSSQGGSGALWVVLR